jgi:hypothetical protein
MALLPDLEMMRYKLAVSESIAEIGRSHVVSQLAHGLKLESDSAVSHKLTTFVVNENYIMMGYDWLSPTIRQRVGERLLQMDREGMLQMLRSNIHLPTGKLLVGSLYQHLVTDELANGAHKSYSCYKIETQNAESDSGDDGIAPLNYRVNQSSKFEVHFPAIKTVHQLQEDAFSQVLESRANK